MLFTRVFFIGEEVKIFFIIADSHLLYFILTLCELLFYLCADIITVQMRITAGFALVIKSMLIDPAPGSTTKPANARPSNPGIIMLVVNGGEFPGCCI